MKSFGANIILENVNVKIEDHDRIGFIGENGKGKSTLLNLIAKDYDYDQGTISYGTDKVIGYLRQDSGLDFTGTIISELRSVFKDIFESENRMHSLEEKISVCDHNSKEYNDLFSLYEKEKNFYESRDGYNISVKINSILIGMGFSSFDKDTPVERLSGGERTRLALAKLLLEEPDLLILDEPTNHLDFKTLNWLENYLLSYKGAILTVSHDRYFLDKIVNIIWELENKTVIRYPSGYTKYLDLKEARLNRMQKEYDKQLKEIAELEDFIAKNIVRASTTKRAQSREKELEHMEKKERPVPPPKPPKFTFNYEREPVKDVLDIENLELTVGEGPQKKILNPSISLSVKRGEKIAIIGTNGVGKSTFIKTILSILPKSKGIIEWGRNVKVGYYDQHNSFLNPNKTMLDEMWDMYPKSDEFTLRTALGHARLTGENVFKTISVLSGGEKARLSFAALTLKGANVLVLDEPTNHMDIICKESLDEALRNFTGTLIMVSHDRYLLNSVPTKIIEMFPDKIVSYNGGYDDYLRLKESDEETVYNVKPSQNNSELKNEFYRSKAQKSEELKIRNRLKAVEKEIEDCDLRISSINEEMQDPLVLSDYEKINSLCSELEEIKNKQNILYEEWETLSGG